MKTLSETFGLKIPLIVAPMAGGPTTPELVAASSNAGALGFYGGAYLTPEALEKEILRIQSLTSRSFGVNLFAHAPVVTVSEEMKRSALNATRVYREELGLSDPALAPPFHPDVSAQIEVVLRLKPAAFSFVFGLLDEAVLREFQKRGIFTIGAATNLEEAMRVQDSGVNAVVAQGFEAGGHRAMLEAGSMDSGIGVLALTQVLVREMRIPVIAAGGIMDGAGITTALKAGAQSAQLGTAFLLADEAGTSKPYREALPFTPTLERGERVGSLEPSESESAKTQLTRAFSGRIARGIENRYMREMQNSSSILPYPAQNTFTRDMRTKATALGKADFLSLWAGTGVGAIRTGSAAEIIQRLLQELEEHR